jgi:hypothetical protein
MLDLTRGEAPRAPSVAFCIVQGSVLPFGDAPCVCCNGREDRGRGRPVSAARKATRKATRECHEFASMSTVLWHPEERANVGVRKGLCYKFGVTGGWKSSQEMYELIRREMIDGRRETRTQCIMLQERGAPWSAKARANDSVERCLWRDAGWRVACVDSLSECAMVPCCGAGHEQPGRRQRGANVPDGRGHSGVHRDPSIRSINEGNRIRPRYKVPSITH